MNSVETIIYTGMEITNNPSREQLEFIQVEAYKAWWTYQNTDRSNALMDQIAHIYGLEVVESRDYGTDFDNNYRCSQFVFGKPNFDEPWCRDYWNIPISLWKSPDFLQSVNYQMVEFAQPGDVIAYMGIHPIYNSLPHFMRNPIPPNPTFLHFGIYEDSGIVRSKFDSGHVFKHPALLVPSGYGNQIVCLRRNSA